MSIETWKPNKYFHVGRTWTWLWVIRELREQIGIYDESKN